MPSFATHHIFAATVQQVTGDAVCHTASLYPAAYRWGAQGLDPLLYYHAPFARACGRAALRLRQAPPAPLFEALCAAAQRQHDTAALAYLFGFCTHYALDRVTLPFVRAQADRLVMFSPGFSSEARHKLCESDLDGIMIAEYISGDAADFEAFRLLDPNAAECTVLARVLAAAVRQTDGAHLSPAQVYRSLHDMRRVLHLTHTGSPARGHLQKIEHMVGKAGLATAFIRPAEPLAADCANLAHRPWSADMPEKTQSFFDLFDSAVPLAVSLQRAVLQRYYQEKPLDPRFFPTNFDAE